MRNCFENVLSVVCFNLTLNSINEQNVFFQFRTFVSSIIVFAVSLKHRCSHKKGKMHLHNMCDFHGNAPCRASLKFGVEAELNKTFHIKLFNSSIKIT